MISTEFLYSIIIVLLGCIGYFVKRILDRTESISADVSDIKPKVKILWECEFASSTSPLVLNERGRKILDESGVKELVDGNKELLMEKLRDKQPQNAYQVQEFATKILRIFVDTPETLSKLQDGAFRTGVNVDTVLFAGGLYLRDLALPKYRFKLADIREE